MRYRFVAVDMDGTLLNGRKEVSVGTSVAVGEALKRGVLFVLCTGRPLQGVLRYYRELGLRGPVITYNGAVIVEPGTGEVVFQRELEVLDGERILLEGLRRDVTMCVWSRGRLYGNRLDEKIHRYKRASGVEPVLMGDYRELAAQGITKIIWYEEPQKLEIFQRELRCAGFEKVTYCTSQPDYLEFFHKDVSKAAAMEQIGRIYQIPREEMIAVGDNFNDLSMIRYAGLGVAMGNAPDGVKKEADFITADNESDGIALVLNKFT